MRGLHLGLGLTRKAGVSIPPVAMTALGTLAVGAGTAGTYVFDATLSWKAGLNADFSNLRVTETDGLTNIPFWVDPDSLVSGTSALIYVRVPSFNGTSRTLNYGAGSGSPSGASTFDIFMDPTDATRANVTDVLALTGSYATTQKGLTQADCGMGALGYLNQGYCHSSTQRFIADSAATSNIRCYNKSNNSLVWTVAGNGHMNQLSLRRDNGNILASSTGGTGTGIVYEYSHVDGSLVRAWDFSALVATTNFYPNYAGPGKFLLMPAVISTVGIEFIEVTVNDTTGTYTTGNTYAMPASTGAIQTMQGQYYDWDGSILGDATPCVYYFVNTSGGASIIYDIAFPSTTAAAIRRRYGTYTWGVEAEGIGFDGTTLEVGVGTSGTNAYIAKVSFNGTNNRFRNGAPRVTSAGSQTFSSKSLTDAGLAGAVRVRAWALWSSPYTFNSTCNRAAVGFASNPVLGAAWFGRISATPTTTQGTFRNTANGTGATSATFTILNQTTLHKYQVDLVPATAGTAGVTAYQDGTLIGTYSTDVPTVANDYATMKLMIGGGAQSDTTGMDQLTGAVCAYALQTTPSTVTVT